MMATVKKLISLDENLASELESVAKALHKSQKEIVESALDFYCPHPLVKTMHFSARL